MHHSVYWSGCREFIWRAFVLEQNILSTSKTTSMQVPYACHDNVTYCLARNFAE